MTIVGCRIDGRLIHGQVANLWTTKLNVSRIMVIDDEVAQNDIEKSGLKLATPPGVKLSILPVAKAAENILAGKYDSQRLFIVARKPDRYLRLIEAGVQIETLNVGNMSQSDETRAITRSSNVWMTMWKLSTRSTKKGFALLLKWCQMTQQKIL